MMRMSTADLALATELADAADRITLSRFNALDLDVATKPDRSPVTDADTAVEDMIRATLAQRTPDDAVAGEERGGVAGAGRCWLIDPIDGTKNFSRGVPVWATLIALLVDGEPVVGMASAPALGRRWWAERGGGAYATDHAGQRPITVSGVTAIGDAYLSTTELSTWDEYHSWASYQRLSASCWQSRAMGDFWSHCLVAEGAIDLAAEPVASPWDLGALQVIVAEAGGRFTDLSGRRGHAGGSALSSNGLLHNAALELLH